jgi:uncharacterized protein YbjQ (UPF0145 family)
MAKTCLKCHYTRTPDDRPPVLDCPKCGAVYTKLEALAASGTPIRPVGVRAPEGVARSGQVTGERAIQAGRHIAARVDEARRSGNWEGMPRETVLLEAGAITITTTDFVPKREVLEVRGIVASDHAYALCPIGEEFDGLVRNVAGAAHSQANSTLLRDARIAVLEGLRYEALSRGANGVIGVRFDYEELGGATGQRVLMVVATGTAVRLAHLAFAGTH